ncbi:hypothetical protein J6590_074788 [Homalodisca vitripennis]|nr:hypothetical protein J6590_074788 [Homalodisca vitripennis]
MERSSSKQQNQGHQIAGNSGERQPPCIDNAIFWTDLPIPFPQSAFVGSLFKHSNFESFQALKGCANQLSKNLLILPCLYILEAVLFRLSKYVLTRDRDVHGYETRGRDYYRTGRHKTVVYNTCPRGQVSPMLVSHSTDCPIP